MNDMESRKFEDAFKDAFQEAEVSPSPNVWTNIELDLEKANGGKMKRRLLFYQLLAAASVAFAMSIAGIGYYAVSNSDKYNTGDNTALNNPANDAASSVTTQNVTPEGVSGETSSQVQSAKIESSTSVENPPAAGANDQATDTPIAAQSDQKGKRIEDPQASRLATSEKQHNRSGNATQDATDALHENDLANRTVAGEQPDNSNDTSPAVTNTLSKTALADGTKDQRSGTSASGATKNTHVSENQNDGQDVYSSTNQVAKANPDVNANASKENRIVSPDQSNVFIAQGGNTQDNTFDQTQTLADAKRPVKSLPSHVSKPKSMVTDMEKNKPQIDPVDLLMASALQREEELRQEEKKEKESDKNSEKLWTSVGFAAGGFSTVNSSVSSSTTSLAFNNVVDQQAKASGVAYSVGISVGTRLSARWVLQGGVNYMTQASDYTAHALGTSADYKSFSAPSINNISSAENTLVPSASYNVNNNAQFVSIPMQAGYLLVNKKVGVQLNGGVSTDLFIQNTITPDSDKLEKTTQGRGEDSPYRSVNFSGLVGTEFSYRFGLHYRLALNPGLRYSLNSIYKSDQPIEAMPLTFDVGLKFRYIFH